MKWIFFALSLWIFLGCDSSSGNKKPVNNTNNLNNFNNANNLNNVNNLNNFNNLNNTNNQNDGGTDADVEPEPDWLIPPTARCTPVGQPCANVQSQPGVFTSFRKDFYLPFAEYRENNPDPVNGGRFQIVANSAVTGTVSVMRLNGVDVTQLLREPDMEWYHVWPTSVTAGEPVWFHFHSRNPAWNTATSGQLRIETTAGVAVDAPFSVQLPKVVMTYVTTSSDMSELLIHLKNEDTANHTITAVWVNGKDALARGACIPKNTLVPQDSLLIRAPLCTPASPGDPWTVVVEFAGAPPAVGSGRVLRPHFVMEAWTSNSNCAFPGGNTTNFNRHRAAGFDTHYMYWGVPGACSYNTSTVVNETAPALGDFFVLIGDDFLNRPDPQNLITNTAAVAGFLTGDESDGSIYDNEGFPNPENKAQKARQLWAMYPDITVYNGAMTNRNVGTFAGMTDVQGIDFYVAACAPHITEWGYGVPLRGAYDYLRNTRNNHMPLPTWMYAQGLSTVWNKQNYITTIHVQPDPQEIDLQAMSVVAAGGKGLMWFQSTLSEADHAPARWNAIARMNWWIRRFREFIREGDINQNVVTSDNILVDQIRSRRALIIPIINLATTKTVSDTDCAMAFTLESMVPHWELATVSVSVNIIVPEDFGVLEWFEVESTGTRDLTYPVSVSGRVVTVSGIPLGNATPSRVLVLAADGDVRVEMDAADPLYQ